MDITGMENDMTLPDSPQPAVIQLDLVAIKKEVIRKRKECQDRGLFDTSKWLSEIQFALRETNLNLDDYDYRPNVSDEECDVYNLAMSYFRLKEYDRCAFFSKGSESRLTTFLNFYSRYLSGEKKQLDYQINLVKPSPGVELRYLKELKSELQELYSSGDMDGYMMYIYGLILKKLSLSEESQTILLEAIHKEPCNWGAWLELAANITDRSTLQNLTLPDHWIKHFFLAHTYQELQLNELSLEMYLGLQSGGLQESTYILAQVAIALHNMRELDQAVQYFRQLLELDPCRIDNLDTFSNLLYVREQRVELAHLAHKVVEIDKYRMETCCIVGNYYSLRSQHDKAVQYFQRALKLNPNYSAAWTLLGHEFVELKNTNAAIDSYRKATQLNNKDYRAWYGLGQAYEILKMPSYCLYYYKRAQALRPNDSRMLMAMGVCYEKLGRNEDALKCFYRAYRVGDMEGGIALFQLARMYESKDDRDEAAKAYHRYIEETEKQGVPERDQLGKAYKFMADYHLEKGHLDDAYRFALKCSEFVEVKIHGKNVLAEVARRKGVMSERNEFTVTQDVTVDSLERGDPPDEVFRHDDDTSEQILDSTC